MSDRVVALSQATTTSHRTVGDSPAASADAGDAARPRRSGSRGRVLAAVVADLAEMGVLGSQAPEFLGAQAPAAPASASGAGRVVRSASTPNPKPYARQSTLYIYI